MNFNNFSVATRKFLKPLPSFGPPKNVNRGGNSDFLSTRPGTRFFNLVIDKSPAMGLGSSSSSAGRTSRTDGILMGPGFRSPTFLQELNQTLGEYVLGIAEKTENKICAVSFYAEIIFRNITAANFLKIS